MLERLLVDDCARPRLTGSNTPDGGINRRDSACPVMKQPHNSPPLALVGKYSFSFRARFSGRAGRGTSKSPPPPEDRDAAAPADRFPAARPPPEAAPRDEPGSDPCMSDSSQVQGQPDSRKIVNFIHVLIGEA